MHRQEITVTSIQVLVRASERKSANHPSPHSAEEYARTEAAAATTLHGIYKIM